MSEQAGAEMDENKKKDMRRVLERFFYQRLLGDKIQVEEIAEKNPELSDTFLQNLKVLEGALKYLEPYDPSNLVQDTQGLFPAIPGFEILEFLGEGKFGKVFRARDVRLHRLVALKVIPPTAQIDSVEVERFLCEARALAALKHANIVAIYSEGQADDFSYLCMELVDGVTLAEHVKKTERLPLQEALRITRDLASALAAIHKAGMIHRDIKASNVMIDREGITKLMDFGIARFHKEDLKLTLDGLVLGTPLYMAPEQFLGATPDERSDLFSLGVLLFELLTGKMPFNGENLGELRQAILEDNPTPVGTYRTNLPAPVIAVIEKLLRKEPEKRFQSAAELETELVRAMLDSPERPAKMVEAPRGEEKSGRKAAPLFARPRLVAAGIAAVLLVAAVLVIATQFMGSLGGPEPFTASARFINPDTGGTIVNGGSLKTWNRIQLEWEADADAFVYIWNKCPDGTCWVLFPQPEGEVQNPLRAGIGKCILPADDLRWILEPPEGEQVFQLVASTEPQPAIEAILKTMQMPEYREDLPPSARFEESAALLSLADQLTRGASGLEKAKAPGKGSWKETQNSSEEGIVAWTLRFKQE